MKMIKSFSIVVALCFITGTIAQAQNDGFSLSAGANYTYLTDLNTGSQPGISLHLNYQKSNLKIMLRNNFYRTKSKAEVRTLQEASEFFELDAISTSLNFAYVLNIRPQLSLSPFVGIGGTYRSTNVVDTYTLAANEPNEITSLQTRLDKHFKVLGSAGLEFSYRFTPTFGLQVWSSYQVLSFKESKDIIEQVSLSNEWMSGISICKFF